MTHPTPPLDRDQVEHEQRNRRAWPTRFRAPIERLYRGAVFEEQHRSVALSWLIGLVLADSFLLADFLVARAEFTAYVVGRLLVMTPLCLAALAWIRRSARAYDVLICLPPLLMSGTLSVLLVIGRGDHRIHYLFGDVLLMICGAVLSRSRTPWAIGTVTLQFLLHQAVVWGSDTVVPNAKVVSTLFSFSGAVVAVLTAATLERSSRLAFLHTLRAQFLNRELEVLAMTDPLTGLANRRAAAAGIGSLWRDERLHAEGIAILMADIDHFKRLNDRLGHDAGDACLRQVAHAIAGSVRQDIDIVARHGGEEFFVVLAGADEALARLIAERIRASVQALAIPNPDAPGGLVTLSLGAAFSDRQAGSEAATRWADNALYEAKSGGRNRVVLVDRRSSI